MRRLILILSLVAVCQLAPHLSSPLEAKTQSCEIFYEGLGDELFGAGIRYKAAHAPRGSRVTVGYWWRQIATTGCARVHVTGHSLGAMTAVRHANQLKAARVTVTVTSIDPPGWAGVQPLEKGIPCKNYFQNVYPGGGTVANCRNTNLSARGVGHVALPYIVPD